MKKTGLRKPSAELIEILALNVQNLRHGKQLSQEELADICGLHRTYIGSVERGERNATLSTLEVLATALDVSVPNLLSERCK